MGISPVARRSVPRLAGARLAGCAVLAGLLALTGCASGPAPAGNAGVVAAAPSVVDQVAAGEPTVLATGLEVPWGIAFLPAGTGFPDGSALVTERVSGRISLVTPGASPDRAVRVLGTVAGVRPAGEGGLMGIAISPAFTTDRTVFVAYTAAGDNRVVRLVVGPDGTIDGAAQQVVVSGIAKASNHDGGAVAFGPDGFLYVSTGDAGRRAAAQDRADLSGKILRVTADGAPAPGNPFGSAVYSYGHRNVQGLAWDPAGRLYATEFGQNTYDEINLITPGTNYGWPTVEGAASRDGFTDPLLTWRTSEASPSGLAAAGGSLWAGALRGQRLWRVPLGTEPGTVGTPEPLLAGSFGRLRAVTATPDGSALWISTSNRDGRGDPADADDRILLVPLR